MPNPTGRPRAKAMSPDERRAAIVAAALPLVEEHGAAVTTRQIAAAAGIAEGTMFRVFADKAELLVACLRTVVLADEALERLRAVDTDLPLAEKLTATADALTGWVRRIGRYGSVLREIGYRPDKAETDQESEYHPAKQSRYLREAIAKLLTEDGTPLRPSADAAARYFQGLVLSTVMHAPADDTVAQNSELVDLFLYGALGSTEKEGT